MEKVLFINYFPINKIYYVKKQNSLHSFQIISNAVLLIINLKNRCTYKHNHLMMCATEMCVS